MVPHFSVRAVGGDRGGEGEDWRPGGRGPAFPRGLRRLLRPPALRRHSAGPPGWLTLWRGWAKFQAMLAGAALATARSGGSGGVSPPLAHADRRSEGDEGLL